MSKGVFLGQNDFLGVSSGSQLMSEVFPIQNGCLRVSSVSQLMPQGVFRLTHVSWHFQAQNGCLRVSCMLKLMFQCAFGLTIDVSRYILCIN